MEATKKRIIRSGPHVLRFYVADGWSRDAVESLLESGHTKSFDLDKIGLGYFVAMPGSMFHRQNLMDACAAFFPANARGHEACPAMMIEFF